jgi:hypothetical protein
MGLFDIFTSVVDTAGSVVKTVVDVAVIPVRVVEDLVDPDTDFIELEHTRDQLDKVVDDLEDAIN